MEKNENYDKYFALAKFIYEQNCHISDIILSDTKHPMIQEITLEQLQKAREKKLIICDLDEIHTSSSTYWLVGIINNNNNKKHFNLIRLKNNECPLTLASHYCNDVVKFIEDLNKEFKKT